jgi:RNA pol II promoter Fmp27 protein domain
VKFIRDQAGPSLATGVNHSEEKPSAAASGAQAAAHALRKILIGDQAPKSSVDIQDGGLFQPAGLVDPLNGWSDGISLQKSHFCLLLKPQIVLRSEESVCVVAAVQAKLQSFNILDESNLDDPISGTIMSRYRPL